MNRHFRQIKSRLTGLLSVRNESGDFERTHFFVRFDHGKMSFKPGRCERENFALFCAGR
jgi:hypothetical protein